MSKKIGKYKIITIVLLICIIFACIGLNIGLTDNSQMTYAASDNSIFTFTPTSESECNVRLLDKTVEEAIIPSTAIIDNKEYTVTAVVGNGFASAANLRKAWLPRTIKTVGTAAFANCKNLKSVTLSAVEDIGTNAFNLCDELEYLILPQTVTSVGATILRGTTTQVFVRATQEEVQALDWNANWNGNNANEAVVYGSDFTPEIQFEPVGISVFGINLEEEIVDGYIVSSAQPFSEQRGEEVHVKIPAYYDNKPVIAIDQCAFIYNVFTSLTICYSDASIFIDSFAFNGLTCDKVIINRDVDINKGEEYSEYLFADAHIETIILPDTITAIGPYMFNGCSDLKDLHFLHPDSSVVDENITIETTHIVKLPQKDENSEGLKTEGINYIGEEAFTNCYSFSNIIIPNSVTTVGARILFGWVGTQTVKIDYEQESDLPSGWDKSWKTGCVAKIIFNGDYNITYILNGGNHTGNPDQYTSIDTIILQDAILEGNQFDGWYDNEDFNGDPITVIGNGSSGDLTLYAKFVHNKYKIIYKPNKPDNASAIITGITIDSNHEYSVPSLLSQNGYSLTGWGFIGWNTVEDGSGTSYNDRQEILNLTIEDNKQISLFAQWSPNSYTVIYNPNKPKEASGLLSGSIDNSNFTYDNNGRLNLNKFTLEGWGFVNWNTQSDGNGASFEDAAVVKNISTGTTVTLYAQWSKDAYSIAYDSNKPSNATGMISGSMSNTTMTYEAYGYLSMNGYSLTGWTFNNWNTKADGTGSSYSNGASVRNLVPSGTITLYAQWTQNTYSIAYNSNKPSNATGTMSGSMSNTTMTYELYDNLRTNGYTLMGWTFINWNTKADGTGTSYSNGANVRNLVSSGTIILYAQWKQNTYIIEYNSNKPSNASGTISGSMSNTTMTYELYDNLRTNGYTLMGWTFINWNTKADGTGTSYSNNANVRNLVSSGTIILYAYWIPNTYSIEYKPNKPASASSNVEGTMGNSEHKYDVFSNLNECAYTLTGWEFTGWKDEDGNSYTNKQIVSIVTSINNKTVTFFAQWEPYFYYISYKSNKPETENEVSGYMYDSNHIYDSPSNLYVLNYNIEGWHFIGWNTKADGSGTWYDDQECIWTFETENRARNNLYAQWEINVYTITFELQGGSGTTKAQVNYGSILPQVSAPTKIGNIFGGFYTGLDGSGLLYYNSNMISIGQLVTSDITLYAKWNRINYYVNFDMGTGTGGTTRITIHYGDPWPSITLPTRFGYNFTNYSYEGRSAIASYVYYNADGPTRSTFDLTSSLLEKAKSLTGFVLVATYSPYLIYNLNTWDQGVNSSDINYQNRTPRIDETTTLWVTERSGHQFVEWRQMYSSFSDTYTVVGTENYLIVNEELVLDALKYVEQVGGVYAYNVCAYFESTCVAEDTMITLADGTQKRIQDLTGSELLLVWNLYTGTYDTAPILFIDSDPPKNYNVINLSFSDGTFVKVIGEHAFWDYDLNKYVYIRKNSTAYIGHWFSKQVTDDLGNIKNIKVRLDSIELTNEYTTAWSPVTYGHLCYFVNGMLSMPGGIEGLFNIFEVNPETMKYDEGKMQSDIDTYGLFTYEEFAETLPVSEIIFHAFGGQYLKVALGKGLITWDSLKDLAERYAEFFPE